MSAIASATKNLSPPTRDAESELLRGAGYHHDDDNTSIDAVVREELTEDCNSSSMIMFELSTGLEYTTFELSHAMSILTSDSSSTESRAQSLSDISQIIIPYLAHSAKKISRAAEMLDSDVKVKYAQRDGEAYTRIEFPRENGTNTGNVGGVALLPRPESSNQLTKKRFYLQTLQNAVANFNSSRLLADQLADPTSSSTTSSSSSSSNVTKSKSHTVLTEVVNNLPTPVNGKYYEKLECLDVVTKHKERSKARTIIQGAILQQKLVPVKRTQFYDLLDKHKKNKPFMKSWGIRGRTPNNTKPNAKLSSSSDATGTGTAAAATTASSSNNKRRRADNVPVEMPTLPTPADGTYYRKQEFIDIISKYPERSKNKTDVLHEILRRELIPVKRTQMYDLLDKHKKGLPFTSEWNNFGRPRKSEGRDIESNSSKKKNGQAPSTTNVQKASKNRKMESSGDTPVYDTSPKRQEPTKNSTSSECI